VSGLLNEVLAAHGGVERWRAATAITAHGTFGGLLRSRFPGNQMANATVRVQLAEQRTVFEGLQRFPLAAKATVRIGRGDAIPVVLWMLRDVVGRRQAGLGSTCGRPPRNNGSRSPADPPTVEEIVAVMLLVPRPARWRGGINGRSA
jgi:hypothetical protein